MMAMEQVVLRGRGEGGTECEMLHKPKDDASLHSGFGVLATLEEHSIHGVSVLVNPLLSLWPGRVDLS